MFEFFADVVKHSMIRLDAILRLREFAAPPAGASTVPARDLTPRQARDLVLHYWVTGAIGLQHIPTFDAKGAILTPAAGGKVRVWLKNIAGVEFIADNPAARNWVFTNGLQLKNVVFIVRFAQFLKKNFGATAIYWGGLGAGRQAGDRHFEGFALDFHGAKLANAEYMVDRDWGSKEVPKAIGGVAKKWPDDRHKTSYRLNVDPIKDPAGFVSGFFARFFFYECYRFGTEQANHQGPSGTPTIGEKSFILHPDSPQPHLRKDHQDHIHYDVL